MTGPTGIYYHPSFSRRSYLTVGRRLADFPSAMENLLARPDVVLYESPPVSNDLLLRVHTGEMIRAVGRDPLCSTAWHSAGGVVEAVRAVAEGELGNAFVFIGAGGHHAGKEYFWGYCCFNDVVLALVNLRERRGPCRVAILDTDAHHADGTRALLAADPGVLHVCLCDSDYVSPDGTKVDVDAYHPLGAEADLDRLYVETVRREFTPRAEAFAPELLIWYFGFDTHAGDYGSLGLSTGAYPLLADLVAETAERLCGGRLIVVLGGGSRTDLATAIIPRVIGRLVGGT